MAKPVVLIFIKDGPTLFKVRVDEITVISNYLQAVDLLNQGADLEVIIENPRDSNEYGDYLVNRVIKRPGPTKL